MSFAFASSGGGGHVPLTPTTCRGKSPSGFTIACEMLYLQKNERQERRAGERDVPDFMQRRGGRADDREERHERETHGEGWSGKRDLAI